MIGEYLGLIVVAALGAGVVLWVLWLLGRLAVDARRADPDARRLLRQGTVGPVKVLVVVAVAGAALLLAFGML